MKRVTGPIVSLLPVLLCAGCAGAQSTFGGGGEQAEGIARLIIFIMIVCAAVWLAVMIALAAALWRRAARRPDPLALDRDRQRRMAIVVGGSVAATVVIISLFTLSSYWVTHSLAAASRDALHIDVRGYQWWWKITYLDADRPLITANEIHVPVGRAVRIHLSAEDVIHSFWVPSLTGKQDLIPGRDNNISFVAVRPGVYRGQCAEFCGLQHARMAMLVIAQSPQDYEAWRQSQIAVASIPANTDEQTGQKVFLSKPCAACHTVRGTAAAGVLGPDLTHVASRQTIAAGVLETTRGSLAAWIADPQTIKPGNNMPMISLSPDELIALSAYMASLK
jgi:cytochrome c oxidase subunit 2